MSRHLKNIIKAGIKAKIGIFVPLPAKSTPHSKGVCYFETIPLIATIRGALDLARIGQQRRKRIVVRPSRRVSDEFSSVSIRRPSAIRIPIYRRRRFEGITKASRRQVLLNLPFI